MPRHPRVILILILAACVSAHAQKKPVNPEPAKPLGDKTAAQMEAERILKERRANAQSLLINLATDARNFNDATARARTQARIADALWNADQDRSRAIFRSAWDAAEIADAESQARVQEDIRQQQARTGSKGYVIATPPDLRREVLELAAKRERKLGEEFLAKYNQTANDDTNRRSRPGDADEATARRLSLAAELLANGDVAKALEFADPALGSVSVLSIDFLSQLREKDAAAADRRYAALVQSAALNPQADANTVSLLASYIFTPRLYIMFRGNGASSGQMGNSIAQANVAPELRAAFFRAASAILLHPAAEQSAAGTDGLYLVIKRLIPLFEQFAPAEITAGLKAQLDSLAAAASDSARSRDDELMHRGIDSDKQTSGNGQSNREQSLLERADRAKTSAERDQIFLELAMLTIGKDDGRARDYVDKIDDTNLRNGARAYVDASRAQYLLRKKDIERSLELARNGELTHLQRSWLLSQTADLIGAKDRDKAASILGDAVAEARRIEISDPDRPRAFLAIANVALRNDRSNLWSIMDDAIRAANSAEKFTGEDGELTFRLMSSGSRAVSQYPFADFNVAGIFGKLADEDYDKAVELARGFQGEAPRASAVIAIARSVLEEKKK
ncbi:MAG TPA: hypothetical protein VE863_06015 [Pyrinomonadaceae bacterium]|jgi:hypothetical protein|nr:hypothetical protein [Pyrinomonadaceae bacterium]